MQDNGQGDASVQVAWNDANGNVDRLMMIRFEDIVLFESDEGDEVYFTQARLGTAKPPVLCDAFVIHNEASDCDITFMYNERSAHVGNIHWDALRMPYSECARLLLVLQKWKHWTLTESPLAMKDWPTLPEGVCSFLRPLRERRYR